MIQKNGDNPDDMIQSVVDSILNNAINLDNIKVGFIFKRRLAHNVRCVLQRHKLKRRQMNNYCTS